MNFTQYLIESKKEGVNMYNFKNFTMEGSQDVILAEEKSGKNLHLE